MRNAERRDILTTGQVARICRVAPRTVSKWVDTGKLRGYRIPGSRDRRIPAEQLAAFLRAHNMPLDALEGGLCRVLIVAPDAQELAAGLQGDGSYEAYAAVNEFEAGALAHQHRPHVIVLDVTRLACPGETCRNIRSLADLQSTRLIAAGSRNEEPTGRMLLAQGFDLSLNRPFTTEDLRRAIQTVTDLIT